MSRLRNFLVLLRGQLWLMPALIGGAMVMLAFGLLALTDLAPRADDLRWLHSGDTGTARELLSALLSGMLTMTSLVVSMTFVTLTLASSQLGPRLVGNFIGDRQIQAILGLFLGTILYVLAILRSLDGTLGPEEVPHLAVTMGSALTVVCLVALLFYIHKIAHSVIADTVVRAVADDLRGSIGTLFPDDAADCASGGSTVALPPPARSLSLQRCGYVQTIDYGRLVGIAREWGAILRLTVRSGHFVLGRGEHVAIHLASPANSPDDDAPAEAIRAAFVVGAERSPAQDLEFSVRKLVEIGLRALSPGINDPFTAIAVIDQLGAALDDVIGRAFPPTVLRDEEGRIRVVANRFDAHGLFDAAFDQIRQAADKHPAVLIHLANTLGKLAPALCQDGGNEAREAALSQLAKLAETVAQAPLVPSDRATALARVERGRLAIESRRHDLKRPGRAP